MFCVYCGKKLLDGETCDCRTPQVTEPATETFEYVGQPEITEAAQSVITSEPASEPAYAAPDTEPVTAEPDYTAQTASTLSDYTGTETPDTTGNYFYTAPQQETTPYTAPVYESTPVYENTQQTNIYANNQFANNQFNGNQFGTYSYDQPVTAPVSNNSEMFTVKSVLGSVLCFLLALISTGIAGLTVYDMIVDKSFDYAIIFRALLAVSLWVTFIGACATKRKDTKLCSFGLITMSVMNIICLVLSILGFSAIIAGFAVVCFVFDIFDITLVPVIITLVVLTCAMILCIVFFVFTNKNLTYFRTATNPMVATKSRVRTFPAVVLCIFAIFRLAIFIVQRAIESNFSDFVDTIVEGLTDAMEEFSFISDSVIDKIAEGLNDAALSFSSSPIQIVSQILPIVFIVFVVIYLFYAKSKTKKN